MNKKLFWLLTLFFLVAGTFAEAQQAAKVWRIGVLVSSSASLNASRDDALRQGLREMGYVEGKNIIMEYRYAEGKLDFPSWLPIWSTRGPTLSLSAAPG